MADNSCLDCKRRYPGCHDRCSEYKTFKELLDKRKGRASREYDAYTSDLLVKRGQGVAR